MIVCGSRALLVTFRILRKRQLVRKGEEEGREGGKKEY